MNRNLRKWWNRATEDQRDRGVRWYHEAREWLADLAYHEWSDLRTTAAVCAALSPRNTWDQNVLDTYAIMHHAGLQRGPQWITGACGIGGTQTNRIKAMCIALGDEPDDVLGGNKVRSFWDNLSDIDSGEVTIDIWAMRAYYDEREADHNTPTDRQYAEIAQAYIEGAEQVGLRPYEFQAVIWNAIREWSE